MFDYRIRATPLKELVVSGREHNLAIEWQDVLQQAEFLVADNELDQAVTLCNFVELAWESCIDYEWLCLRLSVIRKLISDKATVRKVIDRARSV